MTARAIITNASNRGDKIEVRTRFGSGHVIAPGESYEFGFGREDETVDMHITEVPVDHPYETWNVKTEKATP